MQHELKVLKPEKYFFEEEPYYESVGDEIAVFEAAYSNGFPVLLKGPTGCGKTRFMEHMAWRLKRPLITAGPRRGCVDPAPGPRRQADGRGRRPGYRLPQLHRPGPDGRPGYALRCERALRIPVLIRITFGGRLIFRGCLGTLPGRREEWFPMAHKNYWRI